MFYLQLPAVGDQERVVLVILPSLSGWLPLNKICASYFKHKIKAIWFWRCFFFFFLCTEGLRNEDEKCVSYKTGFWNPLILKVEVWSEFFFLLLLFVGISLPSHCVPLLNYVYPHVRTLASNSSWV